MAEEFKKPGLMDGMGENNDDDDFKYDPEGGGNAKYRLPFALCKENGSLYKTGGHLVTLGTH